MVVFVVLGLLTAVTLVSPRARLQIWQTQNDFVALFRLQIICIVAQFFGVSRLRDSTTHRRNDLLMLILLRLILE